MDEIISHPWVIASSPSLLPLPNNNVILCRYASSNATTSILQQLEKPVIIGPESLYGTVWETLKVLWRKMSQEKIIAALLSNE